MSSVLPCPFYLILFLSQASVRWLPLHHSMKQDHRWPKSCTFSRFIFSVFILPYCGSPKSLYLPSLLASLTLSPLSKMSPSLTYTHQPSQVSLTTNVYSGTFKLFSVEVLLPIGHIIPLWAASFCSHSMVMLLLFSHSTKFYYLHCFP